MKELGWRRLLASSVSCLCVLALGAALASGLDNGAVRQSGPTLVAAAPRACDGPLVSDLGDSAVIPVDTGGAGLPAVGEGGRLRAAGVTTNDPGVTEQWALTSINAFSAWDHAKVEQTVTVAILDLGCDVYHEDLAANIVDYYNAFAAVHGGDINDMSPYLDNFNHGTHVAGIIAGVSDNGVGITGTSYNARILPIKVVDDANGEADTQTLVHAYDYILSHADDYNIRVINISMGALGAVNEDEFLQKIDEAYARGIVTVAAAGNGNASWVPPYDCYPGDYHTVVSVINLEQAESGVSRYLTSNFNATNEQDKNISAPGTGILSTIPGNGYGYMTGTSMATPQVSSVLALEFTANPALTAQEAVDILYATARDIGVSGWDATYGYGEVDANAAVLAALEKASSGSGNGSSSGNEIGPWTRLGGENRYQTMEAIAKAGFGSSGWAVVATGENFPDALAASALAGAKACPIILTSSQALSAEAHDELERLGVQYAYVVGGVGAVSDATMQDIERMGIQIKRLDGQDRTDTSLKVYEALRNLNASYDTVVVATGNSFPDSLSIGPWSFAKSAPILLTKGDGTLTDAEVEAINGDANVKRIVVVGGTGSVSDMVEEQVGDGRTVIRLSGEDRYATSAAIAQWETDEGLGWTQPAVATGANFPDALSGSALCGIKNSVLLLVQGASDPTVELLRSKRADVTGGFVLGGEGTVPQGLVVSLL